MTTCACTGCTRPLYARDCCRPHYQRLWRSGDPTIPPSRTVDHVAVDRAVAGLPVRRLTVAEKEAAVLKLTHLGVPAREIAERVGLAGRGSVVALRQRVRARSVAVAR
jgi:hypothetical protein